jgi:hypothetical protein
LHFNIPDILIYCSWSESQVALIGRTNRKTHFSRSFQASPSIWLNVSRCLVDPEEIEASTARKYGVSAELLSKGRNNEIASIEIPGGRQLVEYRRIDGSFGLPAILGG